MELELYKTLKKEIQDRLPEIKHVALFNNQFEHSNGSAPDENSFLYPCVFIQFSQSDFKDLSLGVQQFNLTLTTHLGFESYKNEDTDILRLKQDLYKTVQRFRNGYFGRLSRTSERQDFNHNNIQVYVTDYLTAGKDFDSDVRPTVPLSTGTTLTISATI